jgi:cbb3-type cytochrome oxidase cytochrome c subunit
MMTPRKFLACLLLSFAVPWLLLVVWPALQAQKIMPEAYVKDRDGMDGMYPGKGIYRQGQLIYAREGCVQCHTQVIRPSFAGVDDGWKKGWGSDQSPIPREPVRPSKPQDYLGEPVAPLGIQRNGPDLANVGYRYTEADGKPERDALHVELFAPRAGKPWSIMPSYRNLYIIRPVEGNGAAHALKLPKEAAPKPVHGVAREVIPTPEAEELVNYLLSLKKDAPVPGQVVAESSKK